MIAARIPVPSSTRRTQKPLSIFVGAGRISPARKNGSAAGETAFGPPAGHRVAFATAAQWVDRLGAAHAQGRLHDELIKLGRIPLLVIDEVGYIPFDAEAANLFFQLVSSRYERATVIVTSNKPFGRWGEVFGDATVAAAMIDRLVHHAEVVNLKGDSYRLKDKDLGRVPNDDAA